MIVTKLILEKLNIISKTYGFSCLDYQIFIIKNGFRNLDQLV
jgi:hypothetical protein